VTRRPPSAPSFMPGDRVELEVLGRLTTGRVASVDQDPLTLEWTYVTVYGETGGTYRRPPGELRRLDPAGRVDRPAPPA
jgi:hypothetical protein